jgi:CBS domain-containing protein
VLRTGRRWHLVTAGDQLVGMMNVQTLNSVPREDWSRTSVQAVMIPRDQILWASPEEPVPALLDRLLSADIGQIPVVSRDGEQNPHVVGIITRDSILRLIQTRAELGSLRA